MVLIVSVVGAVVEVVTMVVVEAVLVLSAVGEVANTIERSLQL